MTPIDGDGRRLVVLTSSAATRRSLGHLAWAALEVLALRTRFEDGALVADGNVRTLAAELGVGKDTAAAAVRRLVDAGLVHHRSRRSGGRYATSAYLLDGDACHHAGLRVEGTHLGQRPSPCPPLPCPDPPDTAPKDTDTGRAPSPTKDLRSPSSDARAQPSLFELPTSTSDDRFSSTPLEPHHPHIPNAVPDPPPPQLPPRNRADALAPGVQRGVVNVAGNLNGNLNGKVDRC